METKDILDSIEKLQSWFNSQCKEGWEDTYGIKIYTLDNPGWGVEIDIPHVSLRASETFFINENDWWTYEVEDGKFKGFGDSLKLDVIISYFIDNYSK